MAVVNSLNSNVTLDYLKKQTPQTQNQVQSQNVVHGLTRAEEFEDRRSQNLAVVRSGLDAATQEKLQQTIGDHAYVDPQKIADVVGGVVGKDEANGKTYVEFTAKDGQKARLWDAGGDNGIGTEDIDFNGAIGDFKNEAKATAANNNNNNTSVRKLAALERLLGLNDTNTQSQYSQSSDTEKNEMIEYLRNYLLLLGYKEGNELNNKIEELLPYYIRSN